MASCVDDSARDGAELQQVKQKLPGALDLGHIPKCGCICQSSEIVCQMCVGKQMHVHASPIVLGRGFTAFNRSSEES